MTTIKKIESRGYTLTHSWILDALGLKRNCFDISWIGNNGMKFVRPIIGKMRISELTRDDNYFGENISAFEEFEYLDMLNEEIEKIENIRK
jgi:hypothetical protein